MNERDRVERFNEDLDLLINGATVPDTADRPAEYREDLELAQRLMHADFSNAKARESILQERLLPFAEVELRRKARWKAILDSFYGIKPTLAWVTAMILVLAVSNWAFRYAIPVVQPGVIEPVVANESVSRGSEFMQFRSEQFHLSVALPANWTAVEGEESLNPSFTGWVAFNSWGEEAFWPKTDMYAPEPILDHLPADGAYIVLSVQKNQVQDEVYGPEYSETGLQNFWTDQACQEAGEPAGYISTRFFKWGRLMRVEVFCGRRISEETAVAVKALLESWNFDPIPAGDAGWATASTRVLLPEEAGPEDFPIITNELEIGAPVVRSAREGDFLRTTQAELLDGSVVAVTHLFQRGIRRLGTVSLDCSKEDCQRWDFQAHPDGSVVLVSEQGSTLAIAANLAEPSPDVTDIQESEPEVISSPEGIAEPLSSWSLPDEIRERLEESWALWGTVWVDASIQRIYGSEVHLSREQVWIEQPDKGLWLSGPLDGSPVDIRITSQGLSAIYDLEKSVLRELDHPKLVPSDLNKMIFPSWSIALRNGTFEAIRRDEIAGRKTLVVDYTNVEGTLSDRFWIDTITGVILRWEHFGPLIGGRGVTDEILFISIAYDVEFTEGLFDPELPPPQFFTFDYFLERKNP